MTGKSDPRKKLPVLNIGGQSTEQESPSGDPVKDLRDYTEIQIYGNSITIAINDMAFIKNLGSGQYGVIDLMQHQPSKINFAVKKIRCLSATPDSRLLNDLNISLRGSKCPYIVVSYGAMIQGGDIWICMEILDSSLNKFYEKAKETDPNAFIPEHFLAYITFCVVTALEYLHFNLKVMHRDVKPSNILIDKFGCVKMCDFGISGNLKNSLADSNVGSQPYLGPERIDIDKNSPGYTIRSDVWSLGITLIELANCKFPYPCGNSVYDILINIVQHPPPLLNNPNYSYVLSNFVSRCLVKNVNNRASYVELLEDVMLTPFKNELHLQTTKQEFSYYVLKILQEQ